MSEDNKIVKMDSDKTYSVIEFAQALLGMGLYEPQLSRQLLLDLNVNPRSTNYDKIVKALNDAKNQVKDLQGYSQWMEMNDMIFARLVKYYAGLLSFDVRDYCVGATQADFKTKQYKDDIRRKKKFLSKFNYKYEFERVMMEIMRNGSCYCWLRTNKGSFDDVQSENIDISYKNATKYTLQFMPQDYCWTTGRFEYGLMYDFNLIYFLQPGVDLRNYDPFLIKAYKEMMVDGVDDGYGGYIPSAQPKKRNGQWAYWTQTSPDAGAWLFKFDDSNSLNLPPLAPLLKSSILNGALQQLQYDKDIQSAYALLSGELKMLDGQKSGEVKNAFAISPDTLGQFMSLVQNGLKGATKAIALPLENTKWNQFVDSNTTMASEQFSSNVAQGVGAYTTIYSTEKMSQSEVENDIYADYQFVSSIYRQFENFLNFFVNKKLKKYEFKFKLDGLDRPFYREKKRESIQELIQVGLTPSVSFIASAYGYAGDELESSILEAKSTGLYEEPMLLQSLSTQSNKKGGRPRTRTSDSHDYDGGGA